MLLSNNDKKKMKDYFDMLALSEDYVETYLMCNNIDYKQYNSIVNDNKNKKINFYNNGLNEFKTRAMITFNKYDLLMYLDGNDYNILASEKLKGYAKIIALNENKNVTAGYFYNINKKTECAIFYESPTYSNREIIETDDKFAISNYLDLLAYKHIKRADSKNCQKVYKKY